MAGDKLRVYLGKRPGLGGAVFERLTPDASTREYFRIPWENSTAIACIYPEPFEPLDQSFLDVTRLFLNNDLPVAEVFDFDGELGVIVQEDLGNRILRDVLEKSDPGRRDELIRDSIELIVRIQATTTAAFEAGSIASELKFDEEKLVWELDFFKTHYFQSLKNKRLPADLESELEAEFRELARELETRATVLCHRDFHAANLMLDNEGRLRIIDHQDARIGSVGYDLVSLLLDRVLKTPEEDWLTSQKIFFLETRRKFGLNEIEYSRFDREFELVAVQRCLKAIGTFSNQTANFGKTGYTRFIRPMFEIVLKTCQNLERFSTLRQIIRKELQS